MENYLSIENLAKHYGDRVLFESISFGLAKGEKAAIIANNGTGKSSLLKILSGEEIADAGSFAFREGIKVSFLAQDPVFDQSLTIKQFIDESSLAINRLIAEYDQALEKSADNTAESLKALEQIQSKMDAAEAWDYHRRLEQMLSRFGIYKLGQKLTDLSGGQRKRLSLALTLLDEPDLLILDEPTNHLDIEMVEWLESYLTQAPLSILMVTHDRYFLDRVCNVLFEIHNGQLYRHKGNYSYFLLKRSEREEALQVEVDKAGKLMKKELEWLRRQPKARTTKSKARIDAFDAVKNKANSRPKDKELELDVKMTRIGGKVLELKKVYKIYDEKVILKGFDYSFRKGERIGIIGGNGTGKSTFLNLVTQAITPDSGKINVGDTIVYGYYNQNGLELKKDKRVIEVLKDIADVIQLSDGTKLTASGFLQQFLFSPEMQHTFVSKLSGGERRRLHLMTVLMKNPNFLILDEPTNDLDLLTLQKLEEFLEKFRGCLIVVSHDRYFMDKLVDHLFIFEGDGSIKDFWGPYRDYKAQKEEAKKSIPKEGKSTAENTQLTSSSPKKKLGFKEKFELETLDKEIPKLEKKKASLELEIQDASLSYQEIEEAAKELGEVSDKLDEMMFRWMELDELR